MKRVGESDRPRQYTIRSVPDEVDQALRRQARREGRSLNDVALEALARGAGINGAKPAHRDLDHLIGRMKDDPELDAALDEMRRIDPEMWR